MSNLDENEREFIMTGILQDEWDKLFGEDEEKERPEPLPGIIDFKYTNAYDVYSANAPNELGDSIKQEMLADVSRLHCKDIHPVIEVMEEYGFDYVVL